MKQEYALITGGAGFIGSHLCDALIEKGLYVICVDNFITGSKQNITHLLKNEKFVMIESDVSQPLAISYKLSYIYHLASPASVIDYQNLPEETAMVNTIGTRNLLQLAREHSAKFLFASTSEIYGDPKEHPQKETYWGNVNPNGIRACYDESKRWGEMITMLYYRLFGVSTRIIRIFNTYGPRMRPTDGRVVSNFINQANHNDPITVYGNGSQTRSFCYVSDLVKGIVGVMESDKTLGDFVNLGNPEEYTMLQLAEKIKQITNSSSSIIYKALPEDDPLVRRPDITKVKNLIGWEPQVNLERGLEETISYYKSLV